jgi:hypothetical protein
MNLYYNSKQKIRNIQRLISNLLDGDFPLDSGKIALGELRKVFDDCELSLDRANRLNDSASKRNEANRINGKIYRCLPILGFILRSTNVRNAFELLDPLQSIADAVLLGKPRLLLSSEWDYVPFAYPQSLDELRNFVLIGLPASEAGSGLLVPLAGHELGHAVWRNRAIGGGAHATLQDRCQELYEHNLAEFKRYFPEYDATDIDYKEVLPYKIGDSVAYALAQAEELFCDMFAYALFGESYILAFAYILAPGSGRMPSFDYPANSTRVKVLQDIAKEEGVVISPWNDLAFATEAPRGSPRDRFVLRMAETSVKELTSSLWETVKNLVKVARIRRPKVSDAAAHLGSYRLELPAHEPHCLGDIINAGWIRYHELQEATDVSD